MPEKKKIYGEKRRELILKWLEETDHPLTGSELAQRTNVSRQVIVQDMSLLKARNIPILATAQGYMLIQSKSEQRARRILACHHSSDPSVTEKELTCMVDLGATVVDVSIEHPVYGDLVASLMLSSRRDVQQFMEQMHEKKASLLSELTDGTHLHTIEGPTESVLDEVTEALRREGFLL